MRDIIICIPLYNRGKDIQLLINNINNMYDHFKSNNINLILHITDFNSTDINLNDEVLNKKFNTNIYTLSGKFNIGKALQCCADNVSDENSILLITDADVCFPENCWDYLINSSHMCILVIIYRFY